MIFDPITVLWIEDNPLQQNSLPCRLINKRAKKETGEEIFPAEFDNTKIPAIFFESDNIEAYKFFRLKLLQHPEEIKEYISLCLEVEDKKGTKIIGETPGILPEVVVFDYKLSDNLELDSKYGISYKEELRPIRKFLNPVFKLNEIWQKQNPYLEDVPLYSRVDFIKNISKKETLYYNDEITINDLNTLQNDQLGLFAGVEISKMFRAHPCVAVPATFNHSEASRMHAFSKFYEWINDYDLKTMFSSEFRNDKKWDVVIPHAVKQLRQRIIALVQANKITLDLQELLKLVNGNTEDGVFTFYSVYGRRQLPLEGLFIYVTKKDRQREITKFAEGLIKMKYPLIKEDRQNLKTEPWDLLQEAINFSERLWNTYIGKENDDNLAKREKLSYLYATNEYLKIDKDCEGLHQTEQKELDELKQYFDYDKKGSKIINYVLEIRMIDDPIIRRWAALFIIVRVFHLHSICKKFLEKEISITEPGNRNKGNTHKYKAFHAELVNPIEADEIYYALFPIPESPIILMQHDKIEHYKYIFPTKEEFNEKIKKTSLKSTSCKETWEAYLRRKQDNKLKNATELIVEHVLSGRQHFRDGFDNEMGLRAGEKIILQWYAESLSRENIWPKKDWPAWLKK
jgi:hypothetical protein